MPVALLQYLVLLLQASQSPRVVASRAVDHPRFDAERIQEPFYRVRLHGPGLALLEPGHDRPRHSRGRGQRFLFQSLAYPLALDQFAVLRGDHGSAPLPGRPRSL
jgi:hypothetical protein